LLLSGGGIVSCDGIKQVLAALLLSASVQRITQGYLPIAPFHASFAIQSVWSRFWFMHSLVETGRSIDRSM
jgi:hypothetical protein